MDNLVAIFPDPNLAQKAAGALLDHGASSDDLSLITVEPVKWDPEHVMGSREEPEKEVTTTTGADAAAGALKGAGVGLGLGALATLATLFIPGFGWVTGGGALATALMAAAGTTAAGAVTGGVSGYLVDQGVDSDAAQRYEQVFKDEGAILSLNLPTGELTRDDAEQILTKYGAADITLQTH